MIRNIKYSLSWLLIVICCLPAVSTDGETVPAAKALNPIFEEGEELVFSVSWMGIKAGTITMRLEATTLEDGRNVFKGTVIGETSKFFSHFFEVKDVIESFFEKETFNSIHFRKNIREGKYRKIRETIYDQKEKLAWSEKGKEFRILPDSKDPIACIFALRNEPLDVGKKVRMNANADGKNYPVEVGIAGRETVKIPAGKHKALVCKPLPTWEGRVFEKDKSKVTLWLSDDIYRVPLKINTKVRIGSLKAILIARKGPGWIVERKDDDD